MCLKTIILHLLTHKIPGMPTQAPNELHIRHSYITPHIVLLKHRNFFSISFYLCRSDSSGHATYTLDHTIIVKRWHFSVTFVLPDCDIQPRSAAISRRLGEGEAVEKFNQHLDLHAQTQIRVIIAYALN